MMMKHLMKNKKSRGSRVPGFILNKDREQSNNNNDDGGHNNVDFEDGIENGDLLDYDVNICKEYAVD